MSQRSTGCAKCYVVVCVITYSVSSFWSVFSMLDLFLSICLYLHPGLAPLLLSADFFKSSTRPLQPAQSGRLCRDQRSVAIMHGQSCFLFFFFVHAHTLTLLNRISVSQCRPAPCSRWMMPETSLLLHLLLFLFLSSALPGALKPCAIWQRRLGPGQISPKQTSPSLAIKITGTRTFTDLF